MLGLPAPGLAMAFNQALHFSTQISSYSCHVVTGTGTHWQCANLNSETWGFPSQFINQLELDQGVRHIG